MNSIEDVVERIDSLEKQRIIGFHIRKVILHVGKKKASAIRATNIDGFLDECYHLLILIVVGRYVNQYGIGWIQTFLTLEIRLDLGKDGRDATSDSFRIFIIGLG